MTKPLPAERPFAALADVDAFLDELNQTSAKQAQHATEIERRNAQVRREHMEKDRALRVATIERARDQVVELQNRYKKIAAMPKENRQRAFQDDDGGALKLMATEIRHRLEELQAMVQLLKRDEAAARPALRACALIEAGTSEAAALALVEAEKAERQQKTTNELVVAEDPIPTLVIAIEE